MHKPGGSSVVNMERVHGRHVWIDPRLNTFNMPFVSEAFRQVMSDAGVRGLGYNRLKTV